MEDRSEVVLQDTKEKRESHANVSSPIVNSRLGMLSAEYVLGILEGPL